MRLVTGKREENVFFIYPEGDILRFNLCDANWKILTRRVVLGRQMVEMNGEMIGDGLAKIGLINEEDLVTIRGEEGELYLVETENDTVRWILDPVQ